MKRLLFVLGCFYVGTAVASSDCEKRIAATGMIFTKRDPEIICKDNPSKNSQDCMVEILTQGRGKLRNSDLFDVAGLCKVDPRPEVKACFIQKMNKPYNDPAYIPAKKVASQCLLERKESIRSRVVGSGPKGGSE